MFYRGALGREFLDKVKAENPTHNMADFRFLSTFLGVASQMEVSKAIHVSLCCSAA